VYLFKRLCTFLFCFYFLKKKENDQLTDECSVMEESRACALVLGSNNLIDLKYCLLSVSARQLHPLSPAAMASLSLSFSLSHCNKQQQQQQQQQQTNKSMLKYWEITPPKKHFFK